ncbi:MAG: hypothetical protein AUI10_10350 [Actinobacteria bacterium 13_2_20CM_2_72_6]|nr:MAG: hypothetical protein AUI10_10350 [Actinobacteria bacterium 13_2_20CM_2_72_6]
MRDEVEATIRGWDAYERARGATPVIDYDLHPQDAAAPAASRYEVLHRLGELRAAAPGDTDPRLIARLTADIAYLQAMLGVRATLRDYVRQTQGCDAAGWPEEYVTFRGDQAREALAGFGIPWDATSREQLEEVEGRLDLAAAPDAIREAATGLEPDVRALAGTDAPFRLAIETADVDAYWAYWLDGAGADARLRLNLRRARFTAVMARQFALHEVLGHALQSASIAARCAGVPWVRLMSVHAPQQVASEGLAQALPLFVTPDDRHLVARVRLAHYTQLVLAELYVAINSGANVADCVRHGRARVPYWRDELIGDALSDAGTNPLLRSYLWSYPAGVDWFVRLAETDPAAAPAVLRAAYREPLAPADLATFAPDGPPIGGPGRQATLPSRR